MMATSRESGVLRPWMHVVLWFLTATVALVLAVTALAALRSFATGEPPPDNRNLVYLVASAAALGLLVSAWRRSWFVASDVGNLLLAKGSPGVERHGRTVRARIGDLWVLATIDRPIFTYWPARVMRLRTREMRGGLRPAYMLTAAQVDVVRVGDFSRLPRVRAQVTRESLKSNPSPIGHGAIDAALRRAAEALTDPDLPLTIEIGERSLHVEVRGGSWLGQKFRGRIENAIAFAERLVTSLSGSFTPIDADRWTVERDGAGVRLVDAQHSEFPGTRLKAIPLVLLLCCPSIVHAGTQENAAAYLLGSQNADGGWTSRFARRAHVTAEALRALQVLRADATARSAAANLLQSLAAADTDDRARSIDALQGESRDIAGAVNQLLADAELHGGWPLAASFGADPLDTALALVAVSGASTGGSPQTAGGVAFLVSNQRADGGWSCVDGGPSDLTCTADVMLALGLFRDLFFIDPVVSSARTFLRARLNPDGSFGAGGPDLVYTSALAARALIVSGDDLGSSRLTVLSFLHGRQGADGAWEADPLVTAVALRAIDALLRVPVCGDGVVNLASEACDGRDLHGRTCEALGLGAGTLACSSSCTFDTSSCAAPPTCGDGIRNRPSEACDGGDLAGATCQSVGFLGGTLSCNADCTFNASSCTGVPFCGDGAVNRPGEQCDGGDLADASCASLGLLGGTLGCSPSCQFNTVGCTGTGEVDPRSITFGPDSLVCTNATETRPVSIAFPSAAVADKVDVFFLFDDTGSFAGRVPTVTSIFNSLVTTLQTAMPGISFGFGVGRFEDYGGPGTGFSGEVSTGRPFTLNQPIITPDVPSFPSLVSSALNRTAPGFGGDGPETTLEALFQVASGAGFDGNGNGSVLDSGVAGATSTQTSPGSSGDVPSFASNVAAASGTLGGVGFRPRALHLVIVAGDICSVAAFQPGAAIPATITGAGGATVPTSALRCSNLVGSLRYGFVSNSLSTAGNTVSAAVAPRGAATVPATIASLNALGVSVIGLADGGTPIRNPVGPSTAPSVIMSALALLTGATDATGSPLVFNIAGGTVPLRNAIVQAITTAATRPVDVSARATGLPAGITASLSPGVVPDVGPGGRAGFELSVTGSGVPRGSFVVEFFDTSSNAVLGATPVNVACLPIVDQPPDADGDGFRADADCNDANAAVNPAAAEIPGNGIDDDCNPATPDAVPEGDLACSLSLDKIEYGAREDIRVELAVTNAGASTLSALRLKLDAVHSLGASIGEAAEALAPLGPGERRLRTFVFPTGVTSPGDVLVSAQVMNGAATSASCSAAARIVGSAQAGTGLVGTVLADPAVVFFRDPVMLRYHVENVGNAAFDPATFEIVIVDAADGDARVTLADTRSLAAAAAFDAARPAPPELPIGEYVVVLRGGSANDLKTLASAPLSIRQPPNQPPLCDEAVASKAVLWPPDHKYELVAVQGVTDPDGDPVTISILGVMQNEGVLENGTGNTCPDAIVAGDSVQVRAERGGSGNGRTYRLSFEATDAAGATCTGVVRVCVPHDQSRECVDTSAVVDSTACSASKR